LPTVAENEVVTSANLRVHVATPGLITPDQGVWPPFSQPSRASVPPATAAGRSHPGKLVTLHPGVLHAGSTTRAVHRAALHACALPRQHVAACIAHRKSHPQSHLQAVSLARRIRQRLLQGTGPRPPMPIVTAVCGLHCPWPRGARCCDPWGWVPWRSAQQAERQPCTRVQGRVQ